MTSNDELKKAIQKQSRRGALGFGCGIVATATWLIYVAGAEWDQVLVTYCCLIAGIYGFYHVTEAGANIDKLKRKKNDD